MPAHRVHPLDCFLSRRLVVHAIGLLQYSTLALAWYAWLPLATHLHERDLEAAAFVPLAYHDGLAPHQDEDVFGLEDFGNCLPAWLACSAR